MQNTFGKFIIKGKFEGDNSNYLHADREGKPPLSIHKIHGFLWVDLNDNPTKFSSTDQALPWLAFAMKHTAARALEIIRYDNP